jgi:hypothetical protein
MRQQAYSNDAQAAARQMMDSYGTGQGSSMSESMSEQVSSMRARTRENQAEIQSMKAQLAAKGYTQEQIDSMSGSQQAVSQTSSGGGSSDIDIKKAAMYSGMNAAMNDHANVKQSVEQQKAAMDAAGEAKQPKPRPNTKRSLISGSFDDIL